MGNVWLLKIFLLFSLSNEMLLYSVCQVALVVVIDVAVQFVQYCKK